MVAERCYAAMGDVAKARYLHKVGLSDPACLVCSRSINCKEHARTAWKLLSAQLLASMIRRSLFLWLFVVTAAQLAKTAAKADAQEQPASIRAQLALLSQQWPVAEALLLAQGQVDDVIALYQQAHR